MKVRNIMFFGFAAAILMGTANAATPFRIASQAYVDSRVNSATSAASDVAETVGNLGDLNADDDESSVVDGATSVVGALDALDEALATKQDKTDSTASQGTHVTAGTGVGANLNALDTALVTAEGAISTLNEQINGDPEDSTDNGLAGDVDDIKDAIGDLPQNSNIADLLDGKVNVSDKATTIRGVSSASDDKWATELAVATIVDGLTGGGGTVSQQIADALGSDFTGDNAYADVTAALADKQDKADSTVAAKQSGSYAHITANNAVGSNLAALDDAVAALENTVGDSNSGLAKDVADLKDTVGDSTDGLVKDVTDLQTFQDLIEGYANCITQAEALREPGDNSAAHCVLSASTSGGIEWTPVTFPWIAE